MKKTLTVLIAAGALLGAAGCSATPQLTNEETCARVKTVGLRPDVGHVGQDRDDPGRQPAAGPSRAAASDDLRDPLQSIIDYLDESAKRHPGRRQARGHAGQVHRGGPDLS